MSHPDHGPGPKPPLSHQQRRGNGLFVLLGALVVIVAALAYFVFGVGETGNQSAQNEAAAPTSQTTVPPSSPASPPTPAPGPSATPAE